MACGLKKQNNEQGVHLTERTCSPYNPIIKLIVDDCLGLPIYPVTSIDAVIDEDGNTLRKLLEDLLDIVNNGNSDLSELVCLIIEQLSASYINELTLNEKLELLYKISSMDRTSVLDSQVYEDGEDTPYIVSVINNLVNNGADNERIQQLLEQVDLISSLLYAIANYDENAYDGSLDSNLEFPSIENVDNILEILFKVKLALTKIADLYSIIGDTASMNGTIVENITNLYDESATHAHLLENVLSDGEYIGRLKGEEYPVTSALFLIGPEAKHHFVNILSDDTVLKVYVYFPKQTVIGLDTQQAKNFDYNGNGMLDWDDVSILEDYARGKDRIINHNTSLNPDGDLEGATPGDRNFLIDLLLETNAESGWTASPAWSKYIYELIKPDTSTYLSSAPTYRVYEGEILDLFPGYTIIAHPLILGKVYVDSLTLKPFAYKDLGNRGEMLVVSGLDLQGGFGIIVDNVDDEINDGILYKLVVIRDAPNTCTLDLSGSAQEGELRIGFMLKSFYRHRFASNETPTQGQDPNFTINDAIDCINYLLGLSPKPGGNSLLVNTVNEALYDEFSALIESILDSEAYSNATLEAQEDVDIVLNHIRDCISYEDPNTHEYIPRTAEEVRNYLSAYVSSAEYCGPLRPEFFGVYFLGGTSTSVPVGFYDSNGNYVTPDKGDLSNFYKAIYDFNNDGVVDISDSTYIINVLLGNAGFPAPSSLVDVNYDYGLYQRNSTPYEESLDECFDKLENRSIVGHLFYETSEGTWWASDGTNFKSAIPEYKLSTGKGSSWIMLMKDNLIVLAIKTVFPTA